MINNTLMIAVAGSGKTTYIVNKACEEKTKRVLITTYTEANELEIKRKIIKKKGCIPSNITIQTWFSFLLQHGVRPYQSLLNDDIHNKDIGFYLLNTKSGKKLDKDGEPIIFQNRPIYWGEKDFHRHYFTSSLKIYSDKISKFIFTCNKSSGGEVIGRISKIYDHIYIDEIQDLAGYDLELVKLFFKSDCLVLLVGDPRQVTYLTHSSTKFGKYSDGKIKEFVENELGKKIKCEVDEDTLNLSHRNNQAICDYTAKLYPGLSSPEPCKCVTCRNSISDHEGIFLVKPDDLEVYLARFQPMQLRWSVVVKCSDKCPVQTFGESKGATFDRVLIYPTKDMKAWIKSRDSSLKNETRAKFYVGLTRAKRSSAIVMNFNDGDVYHGVTKYSN